ncbi:TonB family protein [Mucilaginibacter corticis]|uniref:TonB family protein n=1 Tax=Mucilaginibacter corticis TaxID=2597670 RepID=A0A556MVF7_9SPHI|nr:M56 family metallopeptidase [Mucilaginibacter corticis]TSJ43916.1 TonB family protein [Mucilaginibacter corticis]
MNWWHYLLLVNFYLVLFFGFYALLLRRETFFQLNRVYLVASALLSFFIPLIQADWVKNLFITQEVQDTIYSGPISVVYNFTVSPEVTHAITLGQVFNAIYIAITVFLILRLFWQLLILKKEIEKPSASAAYSFFKKISLGDKASQSKIIAEHEQVHAGQWHSVDVMIIEMVMIINWFNPVVYLYRFAIKYIHEFIADRQVINAGTDKADYALLLLSQTFEVDTHNLVTPFFNRSLLKQRIMMMQKDKSHRIALAKYGLSAPLFILMLIFSSATVNNSKAVKVINKKTETILSMPANDMITNDNNNALPELEAVKDTTKDTKIYNQVETQPQFPGGLIAFGKFLGANIHYPAADREAKVQGTVIATFVVETSGTLSNINAVRGPSAAMKKEALRVLLLSPKWKPGYQNNKKVRVLYTVPIKFTLDNVKAAVVDDKDKIHLTVDKQPSFPGGLEAFGKYLGNTVKYPASDREKGTSGRVICTFVVERNGTLTDITALNGPSQAMKDESVRVLKLSPRWQPGLQGNKPVRVQYTVPISFVIGPADNTADDKGKVYSTVEKQPMFPGGLEAFSKYLSTNLRYPEEDKNNGVAGRVIVTFVVEKDGTLSDIKAVRGPSETLKNEAVRVLTRSPKWQPGYQNNQPVRVSYAVPIAFTAQGDNKKPSTGAVRDTTQKLGAVGSPLYIIDGHELEMGSAPLATIPQDDIASMEILKDENATKRYGDKGKNGVILITTKKNGGALKEVMANNTPPLFFVDDKEIKIKSAKEGLAIVPQDKIALMEVFKGSEAIKLFGDRGKDGVIKITTVDGKKKINYIK